MSKQILFVDDEPSIRGIYGMLQPFLGEEYSVATAADGREALNFLHSHPVHLVVSDLTMPNMTGLELLSQVSRDYPATPRIIVSGFADEVTAAKCLMVAHRYFSKPFDPTALTDVVLSLCDTQDFAANDKIRQFVGKLEAVPTLSQTYLDLTKALRSPTVSLPEISAIIEKDLALTAKVLQMVNSVCFATSVRVDTMFEAIQRIGFEVVRAMVLSIQVFEFCSHIAQSGLFSAVWQHSLRTAVNAKRIAAFENLSHQECEQAFLAGLLHDIGKVVLAANCREYHRLWEAHGQDSAQLAARELETFGATHAHIGAYLLRLWGLPKTVTDSVLMHHSLEQAQIEELNPLLAVHLGQELSPDRRTINLDEALLEKLRLCGKIQAWSDLLRSSPE